MIVLKPVIDLINFLSTKSPLLFTKSYHFIKPIISIAFRRIFMKIKHLITAAAVFCSLTVCASASEEGAAVVESETQANIEEVSEQADELSVRSVVVANDGEVSNVDTGVGSVAAVVGIITLAGAVVVISRKKS